MKNKAFGVTYADSFSYDRHCVVIASSVEAASKKIQTAKGIGPSKVKEVKMLASNVVL